MQNNLARHLLACCPDDEQLLYCTAAGTITRGQFRAMVARLASQFAHMLQPGQHVVLALNDSPWLSAAFLAAIAVGAVPAAINPRLARDQIGLICTDGGAAMLIIENERLLEMQAACDKELVSIISRPGIAAATGDDNDLHRIAERGDAQWDRYFLSDPHAICYLQYTSGSTGAPKGVIHTFNNSIAFIDSFARAHLALGSADILYSVPKMFFGYGMGNSLFFPLYCGAAAVLDERWPDPAGVLENLARFRPTVFFSVPAMYRALRPHAATLAPGLRIAFSAGAPLPAAEFAAWQQAGVAICDGIGATEVGHVFLANAPGQARAGVTGSPLAGYECRLLDDAGAAAPAGTAGVLMVKGPGVSPGYLNGAASDRARFAGGWYRTGDLFLQGADGSFTYQGREDDKFKVNGRWVVPIVIERAVCERFPHIQEAALVPSTHAHDGEKPTLFITLQAGHEPAMESHIEGWLNNMVESHSFPRRIVRLDAMPRNDNGKLVKRELVRRAAAMLHGDA